nr:hypothetical protein [Pandoravirus belohorizontensis]
MEKEYGFFLTPAGLAHALFFFFEPFLSSPLWRRCAIFLPFLPRGLFFVVAAREAVPLSNTHVRPPTPHVAGLGRTRTASPRPGLQKRPLPVAPVSAVFFKSSSKNSK